MAKIFYDIQAFFAFLNVLQDETKRVDVNGNAVDLLSNLDSSGDTNLAVELAKIYSWYTQTVEYDTSVTPHTFKIKSSVIPSSFDNVSQGYLYNNKFYDEPVVEGYLYNGSFYEDAAHQTLISPEANTIYIDKGDSNAPYEYTSGAYSSMTTTQVNAHEIPGKADKIYVDLNDDTIYRYESGTGYVELMSGGGGSTYAFRTGSTDGAFEVQEDGGAWQTIYVRNVATLDSNGKIPASQLPSYVDDVVEGYKNNTSFYDESDCVEGYLYNGTFYEDAEHTTPVTPAADTLYLDKTTSPYVAYVYDTDTTAYVTATAITPEDGKIYVDKKSNTTYRWSGTQYTQIKGDLALGNTHDSAAYGDEGATAYAHSQVTSGNPHNVTKSDIGLGNVDNTADANKSVSSAATLTTARTIDGVSFDGSANITHYGTCSTAASTTTKDVSCTGFTKAAGARIAVKFTTTNTGAAANLQLNVNSTGGAPIKWRGSALPDAAVLSAGNVYEFIYDGTNYELVGDLDTGVHTGDILILHCTQNPSLLS